MIKSCFKCFTSIVIVLFIVEFLLFQIPNEAVQANNTSNPDLEELINGSDCIIIGSVIDSSSYWNAGRTGIYTSYLISVDDSFKMALSREKIMLTLPGGKVDDTGQWVSGQTVINKDEHALYFLSKMTEIVTPQDTVFSQQPVDGQFTLYGGLRGKFTIEQGQIGDMPVSEFADRLRNKLQGQAVSFQEMESSLALVIKNYSYTGYCWAHVSSPVVTYRINENTTDCTGESAAVQAAAATWNAAGARFTFSYAGTTSATAFGNNGINEIMWRNYGKGGIVAQTSIWYNSITNLISECDMEFNDYYLFSTDLTTNSFDIRTVALHELGHFLCLDDLYNSADSAKVMYGYCSPVPSTKRILHSDDIAGIQYIYGAALSLVSISISPESSVIICGRTQQFTATGSYSDNSTKDLTASVTWSSDDASVATIDSQTGAALGVALGQTTIRAAFSSINASTLLTVLQDTLKITTSTPLPDGQVGLSYNHTLNATGGVSPYFWSIQGTTSLPSGLSLNASSGVISGTPTAVGGPMVLTVNVSDRYALTDTAELSITIKRASTIVLTSSSNPEVLGRQVVFTAKVEAVAPEAGVPGGNVTFKDGETTIGMGILNSKGRTDCSINFLATGSHPIEAIYEGDAVFAASTASILNQNVVVRCDVNGDGVVDMGDAVTIERVILETEPSISPADTNLDGLVNMGDVVELERTILGLSLISSN